MKSRGTIEIAKGSDILKRGAGSKEPKASDGAPSGSAGEPSEEISAAELQDFLAAEYLETRADPKFKEDLRKKLWNFVDQRYGKGAFKDEA